MIDGQCTKCGETNEKQEALPGSFSIQGATIKIIPNR